MDAVTESGGDQITIRVRGGHPDFLDLPWHEPLAGWTHERLTKMAHGVSRHVVRFVRYDHRVYALKATETKAALHEYQALRRLREDHLPVVEPVGTVTGRPTEWSAVLITRYLDYALPYWYVLGRGRIPGSPGVLLDAGAVLFARMHLAGVFWGDGSLSNILFRRDAGASMAYLVDAETLEVQPSLSDQMRERDIEIAVENVAGGLLDLQAQGRVSASVDPLAIAEDFHSRYEALWDELTRTDEFDVSERWRIDSRIRRLNDLGFDVEELAIDRAGHDRLRITPTVVEEGHHCRVLRRRTGLEVQENQARRLLADIENFRAWLERESGQTVLPGIAAARWLGEVYEPMVDAIPTDLKTRLEPPELFHRLLDHRHELAERHQREVGNEEALADYLDTVLDHLPPEKQLTEHDGEPPDHGQ